MINKIAICDDEIRCCLEIRGLVQKFYKDYMMEIDIYSSVEELEEIMKKKKYDLYILDIEMPGKSGIDLKEEMELENMEGMIIFITSYETFIRRAFGKNVCGYIDKPILQHKEELYKKLEWINNCNIQNKVIETIMDNGDKKIFKLQDIMIIKALRNYTKIILNDGSSYIKRKSLEEWETELEDYYFVRIQKSFMVNLKYVKSISEKVLLQDGQILTATRDKEKLRIMKEKYLQYKDKTMRMI